LPSFAGSITFCPLCCDASRGGLVAAPPSCGLVASRSALRRVRRPALLLSVCQPFSALVHGPPLRMACAACLFGKLAFLVRFSGSRRLAAAGY